MNASTAITRAPLELDFPPAEVLAEMWTAARAGERLAAAGQAVRFDHDPATGRVTAALVDADGNVSSTLSLCDVLAIAAGAPPF